MNPYTTSVEPSNVPAARDRYPGAMLFALLESIRFGQYEAVGRWAPTIGAAKASKEDFTSVDSREYRFFRVAPEHSEGYRLVRVVPISIRIVRRRNRVKPQAVRLK